MVNVGSQIPFNLHNKVIPPENHHTISRSTSGSFDLYSHSDGDFGQPAQYQQPDLPNPYAQFSTSYSYNDVANRSRSGSREREGKINPILNVRLVGFVDRRGRSRQRKPHSSLDVGSENTVRASNMPSTRPRDSSGSECLSDQVCRPFSFSPVIYKRYAGIVVICQTQATGVECAICELGRLTYALVLHHRLVPLSPEKHSRPKTCNDGGHIRRLYDYDHIYWRSYRGAQPDILIRSRNTTLRTCARKYPLFRATFRWISWGCCVCRYVAHFYFFVRNHDISLGLRRNFKGILKGKILQLDAPARPDIITAQDNYQAITLHACFWIS